MDRLNAAQQQVRINFLQQVDDGRLDKPVGEGSALPNLAFEIFPDQVDVFVTWPEAPGKCRETIALYFVGEGASAEKYRTAREHVVKNWHDLNHEDIGIIERMQAGRYSEGFDGGVLSPYWDPVQQHYAKLITASIRQSSLFTF